MEQKINYQRLLDGQISEATKKNIRPTLLLHACCAPCSSYVLEYLTKHFDITLFFYNPNIAPISEYDFRAKELERLIKEMPLSSPVKLIIPEYDTEEFDRIAKGKESEPERGSRCTDCYFVRLKKTAEEADRSGFDYFSTTLSISPHKDAVRLNKIGFELSQGIKSHWLFSDFKKRSGYLRSIELSEKYNLYRQSYCGCVYSKKQP